MNDIDVILNALTKEREQLHQQLMQIDRIIKRVKCGTYSNETTPEPKQLPVEAIAPKKHIGLSTALDLKLHVLKVFDVYGCAITLKQIQTEFTAMTDNKMNIRETVRSLHKSTLLKLMRDKTNSRGYLWVKSDWLEQGELKDQHKPQGFDLLYNANNIVFE